MAVLLAPAITFADPSFQDGGDASVLAPSAPSFQDGGDASVMATPAPVAPATPSSGGGSSSSSGGTGFVHGSMITTPISANININTSCVYLKTYLKFGNKNDSAEVTKLQSFLKNTEGLNVDINGTFDQKTFDGVKAFQTKYVVDTMGPWGSKTPTGDVFYTTKNKINEIVCKTKVSLTSSELASIKAYKDQMTNPVVVIAATSTPSDSQTAAVVKAPTPGKIKGFFKWLFGY